MILAFHSRVDVCLGGDTRSPEGTVKILVEKAGLQGTFLEAANYYVINVSASFKIHSRFMVENFQLRFFFIFLKRVAKDNLLRKRRSTISLKP